MATYAVDLARPSLSVLVARAEAGEDVVLTRGAKPVARIVAIQPKPKRRFGRLKGKGSVGSEFFEPLPPEELALWE